MEEKGGKLSKLFQSLMIWNKTMITWERDSARNSGKSE